MLVAIYVVLLTMVLMLMLLLMPLIYVMPVLLVVMLPALIQSLIPVRPVHAQPWPTMQLGATAKLALAPTNRQALGLAARLVMHIGYSHLLCKHNLDEYQFIDIILSKYSLMLAVK